MNKIDINVQDKCGVYLIVNLKNGKRYIGSSINIYNRLHDHICNLKKNKAHNAHLQAAWNKYGEDSFNWSILEYCDEDIRFKREQFYISTIKPEYNLTLNVIANFGHTISEECKNKISNTLKRKYAAGEIKTYRQNHTWTKCYIYNIHTFKLVGKYDCIADAAKALKVRFRNVKAITRGIINNKYVVSIEKLHTLSDVKNYIYKRFSITNKWLVVEENSQIIYYRTIVDCAKKYGISRSAIMRNINHNKIYVPIKNPNIKIYYLNEFQPLSKDAVPIEESLELPRIKNGKFCDENTVVNIDNKKSISPYSIETEPIIE